MNPHNFEQLKSCTNKYLEQLKHEWKCHTRKTQLQKSSMFFTDTVFNITYIFTNCVHNISYIATHYQYKYIFLSQDHI
jgi:hypothetical protein